LKRTRLLVFERSPLDVERGDRLVEPSAIPLVVRDGELLDESSTSELERRASLLERGQSGSFLGRELRLGFAGAPIGSLRIALGLTLELVRERFNLLVEVAHVVSIRSAFGLVVPALASCTAVPSPSPPPVSKPEPPAAVASASDDGIDRAFAGHESGVHVEGQGVVVRILRDDREGDRHQRFVLRLDSGRTILVAHNIDLAERLAPLAPGDRVAFSGEYAWNEDGGVVHWTHRDPAGRHPEGWLECHGRRVG